MRLPRLGYRIQIALAFAGLAVLLSSGLSMIAGHRASTELSASVGKNLTSFAREMAGTLDRDMWSRSGEIQVLSELEALRHPDDIGEIRRLLDRLQSAIPLYSWIGYIADDGKVLASTQGILEGADLTKRPVFIEGSKGLFIGDVHDAVLLAKLLPNPSGEPMKFVDVAVPVMGLDGKRIGVLAAHLSWAWASATANGILARDTIARGAEIFVVGADRTVLMGLGDVTPGMPLDIEAVHKAQASGKGWSVETWPDGRTYLTGYARADGYQDYAGLGWTMVAREPIEQAFAPAEDLSRDILIAGAGGSLVCALFGWFVAGRMSAPLQAIADSADRIRNGETDRFPPITGPVEVARLAGALRAMMKSMIRKDATIGQLTDMAEHDTLTGLYNRAGLAHAVRGSVQRAQMLNRKLGCLYLDLDGFKGINDKLGHATGDAVLVEVAKRLAIGLRDGDIVARLGGDEFVMVLPVAEDKGRAEINKVAERIIGKVTQPIMTAEGEVSVGCSIGAAMWMGGDPELAATMHRADEALYVAKRAGGRRLSYDPGFATAA